MSEFLRKRMWLLAALFAGLTTGYVALYSSSVAAYADQDVYYLMSRFIVDGGKFHYYDIVRYEYGNPFFVITEKNLVYPVYPPGYPLALAAVTKIFGDGAEFYFSIALVGVCVVLMYAFARLFLPPVFAFLGAVILGASPTVLCNAVLKNAHTLELFLALAAFYILIFCTRRRGVFPYLGALFCGLLLGYNAGVRVADIVLLLAPLIYVLTAKKLNNRYLALLAGIVGAAIPLALAGYYNYQAFGSPFKSGYSYLGVGSDGFAIRYFVDNFWIYLYGLIDNSFGPAFGVLALCAVLFYRGTRRSPRFFWAAWILPVVLLYHFYFWADNANLYLTMRFWEPVFPAMIVVGLIGARRLWQKIRGNVSAKLAIVAGAIAVVAQCFWMAPQAAKINEILWAYHKHAELSVTNIEQRVPPGAYIFYRRIGDGDTVGGYSNHEELQAVHKWRLFDEKVLTDIDGVYSRAQKNSEFMKGKSFTFQNARNEKFLSSTPVELLKNLIKDLTVAKTRGVPFYYYGTVLTIDDFKQKTGACFDFGEPEEFEDIWFNYLMFPQGKRVHNVEEIKPFGIFANKVVMPLFLKDTAMDTLNALEQKLSNEAMAAQPQDQETNADAPDKVNRQNVLVAPVD